MDISAAREQICGSGALFSVKFIGLIEVQTALHDIDRSKTEDLAYACAVLIAKKAEIESSPFTIKPEIKELIGDVEPKIINKDIELTITHRVVTMVCSQTSKMLRKIDITNISIAVVVKSIVPNAFIFFGKVKSGGEFKRFCFLNQSSKDPENIYSTFEVAFSFCGQNEKPSKKIESIQKNIDEDNEFIGIRNIAEPYTKRSEWLQNSNERNRDISAFGSLNRGITKHLSLYTIVDEDSFPPNLDMNELSNTLCTEEKFKIICEGLEKEPWFFGKITRSTAESYLSRDGSFLVRVSETRKCTAILTIRNNRIPYHIMLNDDCGNLKSLGRIFPTILHLICYHYRNKIPFTSDDSDPIKLLPLYPVSRPQPLSNNWCF